MRSQHPSVPQPVLQQKRVNQVNPATHNNMDLDVLPSSNVTSQWTFPILQDELSFKFLDSPLSCLSLRFQTRHFLWHGYHFRQGSTSLQNANGPSTSAPTELSSHLYRPCSEGAEAMSLTGFGGGNSVAILCSFPPRRKISWRILSVPKSCTPFTNSTSHNNQNLHDTVENSHSQNSPTDTTSQGPTRGMES